MYQPFLGSVQYFAFSFAPRGWAACNGQLLPIAQNQALFALLGVNYGGDGRTTFGLPDMRGRAIQGWSNSNQLGEKTGTEGATLLVTNLPVHTHTAPAVKIAANSAAATTNVIDPTNNYPAGPHPARGGSALMYTSTPDTNAYLGTPTVVVGITGNNIPFNTLNPYLTLNCCIALQGLFPSRN